MMVATLAEELAKAEARVQALKTAINQGPCLEYGHDWNSIGGACAGCSNDCCCSVPVNVCSKCGDCDYGDNQEADQIKAECEKERSWPAQ